MRDVSLPIERLVGVQIVDEPLYQEYRKRMLPILAGVGGRFVVDVRVSEVLRAPDQQRFNRLFTIRFPSEAAMQSFFSDPAYLAVKAQYFVPSVSSTASLAKYQVQP